MKRSRRLRRAKPAADLGLAADVATDTSAKTARPPRANRYARMKLPHERDESTHSPGAPNPVTMQGMRDVDAGKTDTDCYAATGPRYDRKEGQ